MTQDDHLIDVQERSKVAFRDLLVQNMQHSGASILQQRAMAETRKKYEHRKNQMLFPETYDLT